MGSCKSTMGASISNHDKRTPIDDTVSSEIDSDDGNHDATMERVEVFQDMRTGVEEKPTEHPGENANMSSSTQPQKETPGRFELMEQNENVENNDDDPYSCLSDDDSCCDIDFSNSRRPYYHDNSSDDNSSFSSNWSCVSDTEFEIDFDNESLESGTSAGPKNDEISQSSNESDNTWSVWGADTMTKFWNGTQSKIVEPVIVTDRRVCDEGKDESNQAERLDGQEYWYNNNSYGTRRPLTPRPSENWVNMNDDAFIFDTQEVVHTVQSAKFLDNPRLEFLILQKLLRNCKDDETSLCVLIHLNQEGLLMKTVVHDCVENALHEKPSPLDETFRFLVDFHPEVLKERPLFHTFLLHCYTNADDPDAYWGRFLTLFEVGLSHYPEDLGFLFHKDYRRSSSILPDCSSPFEMACVVFGKERVVKAAEDIITKSTQVTSNADALLRLVVAVTINEKITFDALYFLIRREPTSTFCSSPFSIKKLGREETASIQLNREMISGLGTSPSLQ